jgi:flavin-dependent dehydrogenase
MPTPDELTEFVKDFTGMKDFTPETDIFRYGINGDVFHDLMDEFAEKYAVDMTGYLWYFHTNEEGINIGAIFFAPPDRQVKRIPVTPALLADFARKKKWDITYPEHRLPKRRYDIIATRLLLILAIILGVARC